MLTRFRAGPIRRQIVALAIAPVILIFFLAGVAEPVLLDEYESESYARKIAIRIEMVIDQIRASGTQQQEAAILDAVSKTGLRVELVSAVELAGAAGRPGQSNHLGRLVRSELPPSLEANFRTSTATGALGDVVIVGIGDGRALAFAPAAAPPDAWISDDRLHMILIIVVSVLPVLLLATYAAYMITAPLKRFADAAAALTPDDGPDRLFDETGAQEIRTLARALNDMRSRVRGLIDDRTRMLRGISHDLRTPLTRLRLRAERSTQPELKAAILTDVEALSDMIGDTLSYLSKEMATETSLKADLPSLLETVCSDFADMGFNVSYQGPERFVYHCKPRSLARAVTNLVENGTKFATEISVTLSTLEEGTVRISVIDNGPGLPADLRDRVLEPFFKADATRAPGGRTGFGLGLSIVNDIARAHQGTIELRQTQPHGLTALIDLPAEEASSPVVRVQPPGGIHTMRAELHAQYGGSP